MRRINILGNAGSGKSTLARMIGVRLRIPVVHLDKLFWEPGWQEANANVFRQGVACAVSGDAWACEGNYAARTFDLRVPRADLNIWLDTPRLMCAVRVMLRSSSIRSRPDLPVGCKEGNFRNTIKLLQEVWQFDKIKRHRVGAELNRWARAETVLQVKDQSQIRTFLASLPSLDPSFQKSTE